MDLDTFLSFTELLEGADNEKPLEDNIDFFYEGLTDKDKQDLQLCHEAKI